MIWEIDHAVEARSICRWSTFLTATGISEPSLFNTYCNVRVVATTTWRRIWFSALMRSAHCRSMRRWTFNGYMALIRSTSLTRLRLCNHLLLYLCTTPAFASPDGMYLSRLPWTTNGSQARTTAMSQPMNDGRSIKIKLTPERFD